MNGLVNFYKENALILKRTFTEMGFSVYGESAVCGACLHASSVPGCKVPSSSREDATPGGWAYGPMGQEQKRWRAETNSTHGGRTCRW